MVGELLDRGGLLAERVDADHHLDRVVAERRGVGEGVGARLGVDRRGGEGDQGHRDPVRPSARPSWSRRSRITPSRSAHGQICELGEVEDVHHRLGDERARARSGGCGSARRRAASARSSATIVDQPRDPLLQVAERRAPGRPAVRRSTGAAPQIRASDRNVLDVAAAMSGGPPRRRWPASRAMSARIFLRSARIGLSSGSPVAEVVARQPGRARAASTRRRRAPRRRRRRSRASRRRCRRRPAARPTSRTSGVRRGRSAAPRPRPAGRRCGRRSRRRRGRARRRSCAASRTAEVAKPSMSWAPLSSATTTASATNLVSALMPALGDLAVLEVLGQAQRLLVGVRRQRGRAAVGVDHQQVPGVGADVEDAEAHGPNLQRAAGPGTRPAGARRLARCPKSIWCSPAPSSSSPTRPTPTRCSAAT